MKDDDKKWVVNTQKILEFFVVCLVQETESVCPLFYNCRKA